MKILGLSCSPRSGGNTETLVAEALEGGRSEGAEVELFGVAGKEIRPCDGCQTCVTTGICHIEDDMQGVFRKMVEADGIIFGTPIYYYSVTAQAKAIIDRTFSLGRPGRSLANKVGGIVVVAGSLGLIDAVKDLYFYIVTRPMLPANFVAAYARTSGELEQMEQCMQATFDLGRQMVHMAGKKFDFPAEFRKRSIAYGTHTK